MSYEKMKKAELITTLQNRDAEIAALKIAALAQQQSRPQIADAKRRAAQALYRLAGWASAEHQDNEFRVRSVDGQPTLVAKDGKSWVVVPRETAVAMWRRYQEAQA